VTMTWTSGPDDPGRARRLAWAELLQRAWREDVLRCPRCGGAMTLVAVILDRGVAQRILRHLGLWQRGPPPDCTVVAEPPGLRREPLYLDY
jgi:hypothetical protein